ncbi:MAG: hypothetical protein ACPGKS_07250 [Coraliomargarita sp.]
MLRTLILLLVSGALSWLFAQDGLEPPFDIPPAIAKLAQRSDFQGSWLRGDGGYRMAIEVNPDFPGGAQASYFNPDSIHVESAAFDPEAEAPLLVIVLRDEGYPGSTYELRYLAERGVLVGTYARPGSGPSEVYFVKQVNDSVR